MYILLILMLLVVVSTISGGIILRYRQVELNIKNGKKFIKYNLSVFIPILAASVIFLIPQVAYGADATGNNSGLGFIAAALSTGLATLGTGIAVGTVASSALGAVSEEPKMLGMSLIFVGLAEGIAIYGLIISIMILGRI